jgi:hypothetical protein
MNLELGLAIAATAYAVLSEWLGEDPRFPFGSVAGALWYVLKRLAQRYQQDPAAQARRTMTGVNLQVQELHAAWRLDSFREQMQAANDRRQELLTQPGVKSVDLQLMGNQVVLSYQMEQDPTLQTGDSLGLGGAIGMRSPAVEPSTPASDG